MLKFYLILGCVYPLIPGLLYHSALHEHICNPNREESFHPYSIQLMEGYDYLLYGNDTIFNDYHTIPDDVASSSMKFRNNKTYEIDSFCVVMKLHFLDDIHFFMRYYCDGVLFKVVLIRIQYGFYYYNYVETNVSEKLCSTDYGQLFKLNNVWFESDYDHYFRATECVGSPLLASIHALTLKRSLTFFREKLLMTNFEEIMHVKKTELVRRCDCHILFEKRFCKKDPNERTFADLTLWEKMQHFPWVAGTMIVVLGIIVFVMFYAVECVLSCCFPDRTDEQICRCPSPSEHPSADRIVRYSSGDGGRIEII